MKLNDLLQSVGEYALIGGSDVSVEMLSQDTREEYIPKTLYFAVPGTQSNGHDYINDAIKKGASVVVCEYIPDEKPLEGVVYVVVPNVIKSMGSMVRVFFGKPTEKMKILAITGTNGKTTIATLLYQTLLAFGKSVALFSTAGDFINDNEISTERKAGTSMEIIPFYKYARVALDAGCQYLCTEATSHALDQGRLLGVDVDVAIFTNLTQDHLDYHKTMESYAKAKKILFDSLKPEAVAIVNYDDYYASYMVQDSSAEILWYGSTQSEHKKDIAFTVHGFDTKGTQVTLDEIDCQLPFVGNFNMYNVAAVYGTLLRLGFEKDDIVSILKTVHGARGRMELVFHPTRDILGIVDYAHTPDALENVLLTLKEVPHNRIITVVGAGGDRDRTKRPIMGSVSQKYSDYTFFTSDNPRTESVDHIFADIVSGCDNNQENFQTIHSREEAIEKAVAYAQDKDIILVAGKGHEDYQIIGNTSFPFSDVQVLGECFKK